MARGGVTATREIRRQTTRQAELLNEIATLKRELVRRDAMLGVRNEILSRLDGLLSHQELEALSEPA